MGFIFIPNLRQKIVFAPLFNQQCLGLGDQDRRNVSFEAEI
jgi:hypothetical protein